jgi:hypothetical protein
MIYIAPTTVGEVISEGHRFTIKRLPSGNFRVEYRDDPETGANFVWEEKRFRVFHGEPKSAEDTDFECEKLLRGAPRLVQVAMLDE